MERIREVVYFGPYFENFLNRQPEKVQDKIFKVLEAITTLERIPKQYLKQVNGATGLYEASIQLGSNIWRVFCLFDEYRIVILLNGFQKKSQKTPIREINKAITLMKQYYESKT